MVDTFTYWLAEQAYRDDPVGDLACGLEEVLPGLASLALDQAVMILKDRADTETLWAATMEYLELHAAKVGAAAVAAEKVRRDRERLRWVRAGG